MMRWKMVVTLFFAMFVAHTPCWADGPPQDRIIRAFHRNDFADANGLVAPSSEQSIMLHNFGGFAWSPLFDGEAESSLMIAFNNGYLSSGGGGSLFGSQGVGSGAEKPDHVLLVVDSPPINHNGATLVGRWAVAGYQDGGSGAGRQIIAKIALTLRVEFTDSRLELVTSHLSDIGDQATAFEGFRLPITPTPTEGVRRITLSVTPLDGVTMVFEDIRLVETSALGAAPHLPPPAGLPPVDRSPNLAQAISNYDFDQWTSIVSAESPVVVASGLQPATRTVIFRRRPDNGIARRVSLFSIDVPPVKAGDFGVTGTISYGGDGEGDFDGEAYFELTAFFPDGTSRVVGTTAPYGASSRIAGHSADRSMQLAMHSEMQPTRAQLELVSDGVGQIVFSNMSIVQFEPPPVVTVAAGPVLPSSWTDQRMIRGAGWSAVVCALLLAIGIVMMPDVLVVRNPGPIVMLVLGQGLFAWGMFLVGRGEAVSHITPLAAGAIAWVVPVLARWVVGRKVHERELRRILTVDAG